ncbi:MAG TPA: penicillin-binding transpeptidase domain-containing protein [Candidatus Acidoferrum sp.]|jgi:penicillin-binding protein 2|nr:penicillin-binding transpeptidase domain-containing protein [Candidatus Acidoferrum sp.]
MSKLGMRCLRLVVMVGGMCFAPAMWAAHVNPHALNNSKSKSAKVNETQHTKRRMRHLARSRNTTVHTSSTRLTRASVSGSRHRYHERFFMSSFAEGITGGDVTEGEDPVVRQAAIDALGNMNGTVVAIQPSSGRVLAMVNQRLALSSGAQPCSTIKLSVALAALSEGLVSKETEVTLGGRSRMNLTEALAHSNNAYFEALGRNLGFDKVAYYAHQYGLGELAGYDIPGEQSGTYPDEVIPQKLGGVGKMCSFGEGISMTPLQLGAMVSAIANGGTLYYLQHPTTPEEITTFQPRIKRQLDIASLIPEISVGMAGAVQYGTARRLGLNFNEEEILGKTGTCSHAGTRFGWFASYANTSSGRIVVVVFLQGGRPTFGPKAAEIAGLMYRNLYDHNFFIAGTPRPADSAAAGPASTTP